MARGLLWGALTQGGLIHSEVRREGTKMKSLPTFPNGPFSEIQDTWGSQVAQAQPWRWKSTEQLEANGSQMRGAHQKLGSCGNLNPHSVLQKGKLRTREGKGLA